MDLPNVLKYTKWESLEGMIARLVQERNDMRATLKAAQANGTRLTAALRAAEATLKNINEHLEAYEEGMVNARETLEMAIAGELDRWAEGKGDD